MGEYKKADTVAGACELLRQRDGTVEVIAGGQTLMLNIRQGLKDPDALVDISGIDRLRGVSENRDTVSIGGATTYAEIADDPVVNRELPVLASAMGEIAGPQVRHNGTIGGGLCYGDPALDTPAVLLSLGAHVVVETADSTREVPISEFYLGYYDTDVGPEEILTDVVVQKPPAGSVGDYRTVTPRENDYAVAGVATRLSFDAGLCTRARVALTNGGDKPMRVPEAEAAVTDTPMDDDHVEAAGSAVVSALDILDDPQVPKSYRETMFRRVTERSLTDLRRHRDDQ
jgi:carbon-monoxide dehydrogenase medium subunit